MRFVQLPWRTAPRAALASPWSVLVAGATALVLAFIGAAAVLYVNTSGSAAISYETSDNCANAVTPNLVSADYTGPGLSAGNALRIDSIVRQTAPRYGFGTQIFGMYSPTMRIYVNGVGQPAVIAYRDDALANLPAATPGPRTGVWIPTDIANGSHAGLGAPVQIPPLPPIGGVFTPLQEPLSAYWCTESAIVVRPSAGGDGASVPVAFVPTPSALPATMPVTVSIDLPRTLPTTVAEAITLQNQGAALNTALQQRFAAAGLGDQMRMTFQFTIPIQRAQQAMGNVQYSTLPLVAVSLLIGLAGVGAVAVQWCQRRQAELRLLWSRGSGPRALGGKVVLELLLPVLLGTAIGYLLARFGLSWYAPSSAVGPDASWVAGLAALAVALLALGTLALAATARTHQLFQAGQRISARRRWRLRVLPWELATGALTVPAYLALARGMVLSPSGIPLPRVNPLALAFPLLVVITVGGIVLRLTRLVLLRSHRMRLWSVPSVQLAVRRLAAASNPVLGILLVGVLAVGALAVGTGLASAEKTALDTKSGLLVGADTVMEISGNVPLPPSLAATSTVVGTENTVDGEVLAVDPNTFARGAWLPPGDTVPNLLNQLRGTANPAPAIRVGNAVAGSVPAAGFGAISTVGQIDAFPGVPHQLGYVVPISSVTDAQILDTWSIWSSSDINTVKQALASANIYAFNPNTRASALDALPFLAVQWTFGFITALGVVLGAVAAAALLLAVEVRRRQNAVSAALALRMGLRLRTLIASHLTELGAIAALAAAVGAVAGLICTAVSAPLLDPAPWLQPNPVAANPALFLLFTVLITVVVVAVAGWTAVRSARTARVGELLRG